MNTCEHCKHWRWFPPIEDATRGACDLTRSILGKAVHADALAVARDDTEPGGHVILVTEMTFGCNQFVKRAQP